MGKGKARPWFVQMWPLDIHFINSEIIVLLRSFRTFSYKARPVARGREQALAGGGEPSPAREAQEGS